MSFLLVYYVHTAFLFVKFRIKRGPHMPNRQNDRSTSIRLNRSTIEAFRLAATEMAINNQQYMANDDERLQALVDHYHATKTVSPEQPEPEPIAQ